MSKELFISSIYLKDEIDKNSYYYQIPAIKFLLNNKLDFDNPITFFIGENGSGKSTLLEAIAIASGFNSEGGSRNFNFTNRETCSDLYKYLTIEKANYFKDGYFLRAETFYNLASNIDEIDDGKLIKSYGGTSLHELSHGESFIALMKNRFHEKSLFLIDEPEAALSPNRLMQLLVIIHDLIKNGSQFIIATHSPILMSYPDARLLSFSNSGINEILFEETDHYKITKSFIDNKDRMYKYLFEQ